jgi:hypothetical protein
MLARASVVSRLYEVQSAQNMDKHERLRYALWTPNTLSVEVSVGYMKSKALRAWRSMIDFVMRYGLQNP